MTCSTAASAAATPRIGSCARASWRRSSRARSCRRRDVAAGDDTAAHAAAEPAAARRRLSDHRARTRHLWGGAASGPAIGAQHPRHARRPEGRHLRAGWLRRCACGRDLVCRSADQEVSGSADPEGADASPVPALRALSLGALLRPNDPQPLSSLRRSQRQRRSGRLPGRHRSSARISDRRPATTAPASMAPMATCTPT